MHKFRIGDRVRVVHEGRDGFTDAKIGMRGTVRSIDADFWEEPDKPLRMYRLDLEHIGWYHMLEIDLDYFNPPTPFLKSVREYIDAELS